MRTPSLFHNGCLGERAAGQTLLLRCGWDGVGLRQAAGDNRVDHDRATLEGAEGAVELVSTANAGQRGDVEVHLQVNRTTREAL